MPGVVPDEGELRMLRTVLGAVAPESLSVRLYVNDRDPALADTVADYEEMTGHGYARKTLDVSVWAYQMADAGTGTPAVALAPRQTFSFPNGGAVANVYGSIVVGETSGLLWWAVRFPNGPFRVTNPGDFVEVDPKLALRTGP